MQVVYAKEAFPRSVTASIFLAGPTPRTTDVASWRPEALELLAARGYGGTVFIPEPRDGVFAGSYDDQIDWELRGLARADCILFWIPRDLRTMPAFTTNVEFGMAARSGKVVLGAPPDAPKLRYLQALARRRGIAQASTLAETVELAVQMVGEGAQRTDAECDVPLHVWRTACFESWYAGQRRAGNTLKSAQLLWTFRPDRGQVVFFWGLHVSIRVAAEDRIKHNEVVLGRPDISAVVLYRRDPQKLHRSTVALIREFRSPAITDDGYVREVPGGSAPDFGPQDPATLAVTEVREETGLRLTIDRLRPLGVRQLAATMSAHRAHVYAAALTEPEMDRFRSEFGTVHGDEEERTTVEVFTLGQLLSRELTDWSTLGMIGSALLDAEESAE